MILVTHPDTKPAKNANELRTAMVFAALMLAFPLAAKVLTRLGWINAGDFPERALMVLLGGYIMATGNALPKMLAPLCGLRDDAVGAQVFRRFAGWTWVLTGLVLATAWLLLPPELARTATLWIVPAGILLIALRWWTLPRTRRQLG